MTKQFDVEGVVLKKYNQNPSHPHVTIPECIEEIGDHAFKGCTSLTNITISKNVRKIAKWAFLCCKSLVSVTFSSSLEEIGEGAFSGCIGLTQITIPDGVTKIGELAFYGCDALHSVTFSGALEEMGEGTFSDCIGLTQITILEGIKKIGKGAFIGCRALQRVTLPSTLEEIGGYAFCNCKSLTEIFIPSSVTDIQQDAFFRCSRDLKIIVGDDNIKRYTIMPACVGKDIVTFSDKLRDESFTQEQINAINEMPFDDRVHFLGCNKEARDKLITFSQGGGDRSWVATSLGYDEIFKINAIQSTEPCAMLVELMKQYESLTGTPMRNICPQIKPTSYKEKDDDAMGDHLPNYVALAINDLVAIQAAANESAAITIQSFFKITHKRKNKIVKDKTEDCCAKTSSGKAS